MIDNYEKILMDFGPSWVLKLHYIMHLRNCLRHQWLTDLADEATLWMILSVITPRCGTRI